MRQGRIKVLVVEDSPVVRELLLFVLGSDPEIEVVGTVSDGAGAVAAVRRNRPDVVTMDLHMPGMSGYDATRAIMETCPVPIIVVSSNVDRHDVATAFQAIEAGAVMALSQPAGPGHPEYQARAQELITAIKLMSEIKVVRRLSRYRPGQQTMVAARSPVKQRELRAVAMGASTGGPLVLQRILSALPADFPAPLFIVQHMADGFVSGLAEWLDQSCRLTVKLATHGEIAQPGCAYIAPDGRHLKVDSNGQMLLTRGQKDDSFCPSVTCLFHSVAQAWGAAAAGVLLTGMGSDGAAGLKLMRDQGALTIAQDERSCVVFGMPAEAIRLGAVERILEVDEIPAALLAAARRT